MIFVPDVGQHSSPQLIHSTSCYGLLHCFFPSLDVCSACPLGVFTVSNNLFMLFTGSDSTQLDKHKYGKLKFIVMWLVYTILPLIGSLFIANLVFIVKYAGLLGLFICYFFPIALQLQSQYVCLKTFGTILTSSHPLPVNEELPLLAGSRKVKNSGLGWKEETYYTPYSILFTKYSHVYCCCYVCMYE